ncbi:MAG TPA: hypothetical protein VF459_13915 [Caulobacteraceae bacterium]
MAEIQIGDAATAGLKLIARRPLSVLAWGLLASAYVTTILVLFGGGLIASIVTLAQNRGTPPDPAQIFGLIGGFMGAVLLLGIGLVVIGAMIQGAVLRSELEPDRRAFASLRLGSQELWLIAVNFVVGMILWVAQVVMAIPLGIVTIAMGASGVGLGANGHDPGTVLPMMAGAIGIRLLGQLVILGVTLWLWTRLCMGPVMSFREREFRLFESWTLTKGHSGQIFVTMLLVWLMLLAVGIVFWIIAGATIGVTIFANADLQNLQALQSIPPAAWIGKLLPLVVVFSLLLVVGVGINNALVWGAVARMYRQLHPEADVATTFA